MAHSLAAMTGERDDALLCRRSLTLSNDDVIVGNTNEIMITEVASFCTFTHVFQDFQLELDVSVSLSEG